MNIIRKKFDKEQTKNMMIDYADVISKAELLYSGERTYNAVIIKKDFMPGTGDYEDPDEIQNDKICECYLVLYEDLINPDNYVSGAYHLTLEEAKTSIEHTAGFQKWIEN